MRSALTRSGPRVRGVAAAVGSARAAAGGVIRRYPEAPWFMVAVFLAFVVARYIQINARMDLLSTIRFEFVLGLSSCLLGIVHLTGRGRALGSARRLVYAIGLLFVVTLIQLPFAADPPTARLVFNDRVFKFSMLTFLIVVFVESPRHLRWFIAAWLFAIFYIGLESVRGLISGGLYWQNQGVMRLHGAVPIYVHPNSLGGVTLGTLPFIWWYWDQYRRWWMRAGLAACAAASLVCVVYSGSRTAYVGLLALVFWFWLRSRRKVRFAAWLLVVGAIVVMIIPHQYIERFQSIGGKEKEWSSKETRIEILRDAWTIFLENPLGVGVASFPAKRIERFGRSQDTHNLYLEIGTNLGVQGLVVFVVLVSVMLKLLADIARACDRLRGVLRAESRRRQVTGALRATAAALDGDLHLLASTAHATGGFIFVRLVLGLFGMDLYEIYWWFGAGLAIALSIMLGHARRSLSRWLAAAGDGPQPGAAV